MDLLVERTIVIFLETSPFGLFTISLFGVSVHSTIRQHNGGFQWPSDTQNPPKRHFFFVSYRDIGVHGGLGKGRKPCERHHSARADDELIVRASAVLKSQGPEENWSRGRPGARCSGWIFLLHFPVTSQPTEGQTPPGSILSRCPLVFMLQKKTVLRSHEAGKHVF